jgi:predicted secreted hydrolase
MGKIKFTKGTGLPPTTFEDVWLAHKKCSEWWYCTGCLESAEKNIYAYQFTLIKMRIAGLGFHMLICTLTDVTAGKHYNTQSVAFFDKGVTANGAVIDFTGKATITVSPNTYSSMGLMRLVMNAPDFSVDVAMEAQKAPVWHCDKGVLQMGIQNDDRERTYYYSFTNMKAKGNVSIGGKTIDGLQGKAWFDRQGGTFHPMRKATNWEWFSLRFFDETEVMLFAFPHMDYYDGTFIDADGSYCRLNNYKFAAKDIITVGGSRFSNGWDVEWDGRKYSIKPMVEGMFNISFFELLAEILDEGGNRVGLCVVEILPGVRNKNNPLLALRTK